MLIPARILALALAFFCWTSNEPMAATISKSDSDRCVLSLDGEIVEGDFARFERIADVELNGIDGESSSADTICLNSPGGSISEGARMAEAFYMRGVGTVIDEGDECYSICAVMFMMGIAQGSEVSFVNRKLHIAGRLGFHRPYLPLGSDELVSSKSLPVAFDLALESIMKIMILANNQAPWSNSTMMRPDLVQLMLKHIGDDVFYIDTVEKAGRFEIEIFGYEAAAGLSEEQAYYACENSFHWQVGLLGKDTDFGSFVTDRARSGLKAVELLQDKDGTKIYSVLSGDAGYSEAGCLIGLEEGNLRGCGYNGSYNVAIG